MFWFTCDAFHYQKIDKYKQKYRKNISLVNCWQILPMKIFTRYLLRELQWKKKFKTKQKKNDVGNSVSKIIDKLSILFIMWITKGIIDETFRRYFTESSETIHFPIALLITVLYRQNHWRIEKLSVLFDDFLKNLN